MFASPIAWADDDHGRGGGDRGRGRGEDEGRAVVVVQSPAQTVVQRRDDDDEERGEDREEREERVVVVPAATPLVNAINNEVANLMNFEVENENEDEVEVEEVEFGEVSTISLTDLGLSTNDPAAVTTAVNANMAALQTFLKSGTPTANAIVAALRAANIDPASVLALLRVRDEGLLAVIG
jgi:hypothetical protein